MSNRSNTWSQKSIIQFKYDVFIEQMTGEKNYIDLAGKLN